MAFPAGGGDRGLANRPFDGAGGLAIQPGTWVELDFGKPATRLAEAWIHTPSPDCLVTDAGNRLFRHHLHPDEGEPAGEFTFGTGFRVAAPFQAADGSRAEVHPDADPKLPSGILSWAKNRIVIHRQDPGPAVETKAAHAPGRDGEVDAAQAPGGDGDVEPDPLP